jgi:ribonuclease G
LDRELLIAAGPGEWRAALLEDRVPVELYVERGDRSEAGSVHLGRVSRLLPALGAALVDIGGDRPAFLPQREIVPHGKKLNEGERVLVQIRREAQGGKAPRVTMAMIAGVRSQEILDRAARLDPPARLYPQASLAAALAGALPSTPDRILADDPAAIPELRAAFHGVVIETLREREWPIEIDAVFAEALSETLALPSGGSVHFEVTRAAVMIDVDSGTPDTGSPQRTGLASNLAAAKTIARQIRLRNLAGGIVIDFVGLDDRAAGERVRRELAEAVAHDPGSPRVLGWTRLGHLELVRPRRARPVAEALLERHPGGSFVKTPITMAYEVLRALRREAWARPGRQWRLTVAPDVATALTRDAAFAMQDAEKRFAWKIAIEPDPGYRREQFQISPL